MKNKEIHAVHEQDLESFLNKLDLLNKFQKGELKCCICKDKISKENFKFIYTENNEIKFCCDKLECYKKVASKIF